MTTMVADIVRHSFSKSLDWPLGFLIFLRISGLNNLHITVSDAARCHCLYSKCDAKQSSLSVHHYSEPLFLRTILGGFFWSLINADFFTSAIGPDFLMNVLEDCIIFLLWAVWVCLIFILIKNKAFQSGASLKILTSSPSMEEFCLNIQEEVILKQEKT